MIEHAVNVAVHSATVCGNSSSDTVNGAIERRAGASIPSAAPTSYSECPTYRCIEPETGQASGSELGNWDEMDRNAPIHDIIRTWLVDGDLNRAAFDVSLSEARSGSNAANEWAPPEARCSAPSPRW